MKWSVTFVVCFVVNLSSGAPQGADLRDDGDIYDDFLREMTSDDVRRVRRDEGRTVMDILTGRVLRGSDDVEGADVVRVTRSADGPMLISPGPAPCSQARDSGPFDGPYQQQFFDPGDGPVDPKTHKLPVLPVHGGLIGHQESLLEPVHKDTIYYATIPFISGYKMTPIISNKKVIVKDLPGHGHDGLVGGGLGGIGIGHGHDGLIGGGLSGLGGLGGGGLGGIGIGHGHDGLIGGGLSGLGGLGGGGHGGLGGGGLGGLGGGGLSHDGLLPGLPGLPGLSFGALPTGLSLGGPAPSSRSSRPYTTPPDFPTYPCPPDLDTTFVESRSFHPQDFYVPDPGARHPLDLNIFFETPEAAAARDAVPELLTPETYVDAIRSLQQQMDHLHSLKLAQERQNQPDEVNFI